jgi:hypothetical protein
VKSATARRNFCSIGMQRPHHITKLNIPKNCGFANLIEHRKSTGSVRNSHQNLPPVAICFSGHFSAPCFPLRVTAMQNGWHRQSVMPRRAIVPAAMLNHIIAR